MEDLIPLLDKDVKDVNKGMDIIDKSLDKVKCKIRHFVQGNHEVWLDNFVVRYPYLSHYETQNALRIKERGYKYHPYHRRKLLRIGKLNFTHGHKTGMHHAKAHLSSYKDNIMYGHTHDLQRYTDTGVNGTMSGYSMGCLKDIKKDEDWLRGNLTNWNHALAIVDFFKNGDHIVHVLEIIDGKTSLWGQYLDGNK